MSAPPTGPAASGGGPARAPAARVLLTIWSALARYPGRVAGALALLLVAKAAAVTVPLALKAIVDRFSEPGALAVLPVFLLLGYALLRFTATLFTELRDLLFARVTQRTVADFTLRTFAHLHALGPRFHGQRRTGGVTRDVDRGGVAIAFLLGVALFTILPTFVEIGAVVAIMAAGYSPWFTAIIAATFVAYATLTWLFSHRRAAQQRAMNELSTVASGRLVDSLLNYETVKYYANEAYEAGRYRDVLREWVGAGVRNQRALSRLHIAQSGVIAFGVGAVMLLAGQEVVTGAMTVGDLVLVNAYIIQICLPLNMLGATFRQTRDALIDAERMFNLLREEPEIDPRQKLATLNVERGEVRFEKLSFGYEAKRQILWDVDFRIAPGGTLAVVGGSGSGKSTIARLLFRFYEPAQGRVLIDEQDLRNVSPKSLRDAIGIVPQDTILFNDTIAYNIAYGRVGATLTEVMRAAQAAQVHKFIESLPEQYDTLVGERGVKLSGGEKQRIAIARAILKNPRILVFDEATSALDTKSERAIQEQLDAISQDRTTLIIAHRLSTVVSADEILVLEHGRVVERGRHAELLARQGIYAQMWALQQQERELEKAERRMAVQPVNLVALTAGIIDGLRNTIDLHGVHLYAAMGGDSTRVTGDPSALQQTLWDLVEHAVNQSPPGGRVELRLERDGPHARLVVVDTAEKAASGAPEPIDLMQVRRVIEQHHGSFRVGAAPTPPGNEYVIELPMRAVSGAPLGAAPARATLPAPAGEPANRPPSLEGLRVLVVDDQEEARELVGGALQAHGARVEQESGGAGVLARLRSLDRADWPDLMVCDIALDEEDGYGVLSMVRALEAERRTPLTERMPAIALSGYARTEDRVRALMAGFQIHLAKPVNPEELAATAASLTVGRRRRAASGGARQAS